MVHIVERLNISSAHSAFTSEETKQTQEGQIVLNVNDSDCLMYHAHCKYVNTGFRVGGEVQSIRTKDTLTNVDRMQQDANAEAEEEIFLPYAT